VGFCIHHYYISLAERFFCRFFGYHRNEGWEQSQPSLFSRGDAEHAGEPRLSKWSVCVAEL
jgi:hypothetical protein